MVEQLLVLSIVDKAFVVYILLANVLIASICAGSTILLYNSFVKEMREQYHSIWRETGQFNPLTIEVLSLIKKVSDVKTPSEYIRFSCKANPVKRAVKMKAIFIGLLPPKSKAVTKLKLLTLFYYATMVVVIMLCIGIVFL
jgi:hypothetical protein